VPLDARLLREIPVPLRETMGAKNGQIVVVILAETRGRQQSPTGHIKEILGFPDEPGIEYKIVQHKYGLPVQFSNTALEEAKDTPNHILHSESLGREDFRDQIAVTIDGEDARDFDDAITLTRLESGLYRLGVHIADVSHYVREDSALDQDAYERGTSVYFPDRSIPMLPPKLSSGICSLKPREDRLVFSVIMDIDAGGKVIDRRFAEGILCSRERMTYTSVAKILEGSDPDERRRFQELIPLLETMKELCEILARERYRRGAVDFDLPEAELEFDEKGRVISVVQSERNSAHRIIEEFMLLANETVACTLSASGGPALYRIHEKPDPLKVDEFALFASALGYTLERRGDEYKPKDFQRFVNQLEGKVEGRFLAYLMLRSFMQARYSDENVGHFGLATREYTHFTSPIRRYPDLIVHRLLKECLRQDPSSAWQAKMRAALPALARHTSARERQADEAEREIERIKKVEFMAGKLGEEFDALVYSVTKQGFLVELLDHFIEGFVPATTLIDDDYQYQEKTHSFVGGRRRRHLELGAQIRVRLDLADRENHRLLFSVAADGPRSSYGAGRSGSRNQESGDRTQNKPRSRN
jgi:ribonuclease R